MEVVTLEDNKEYIVLDTIKINQAKYIYLMLATDEAKKSFCIRKLIDNDQFIAGLENEEEYKMALDAYNKKYIDIVASA